MSTATLMRGFDSRAVEIDGVRTHYYVGGTGRPLILVHGLGGAAANWTEVAPLLATRRRVLVPDLPGHGRTARLAGLRSLTSFADHVRRVAEHERMLPAPVVGHSLGGVVALRFAAVRPDAVRALVLVCAAGIAATPRRDELALRALALLRPEPVVARLRHLIARRPELRRAAFAYWGAVDPAALSPESVLGILEGTVHNTDVASARRALFREDPRLDLHQVTCPTLLVWGARDRVVPVAAGFEYARRLRAPIRTVAAAGHLVIVERAAECAALIDSFLDRVGEVDELPGEGELVGEPGGERLNA